MYIYIHVYIELTALKMFEQVEVCARGPLMYAKPSRPLNGTQLKQIKSKGEGDSQQPCHGAMSSQMLRPNRGWTCARLENLPDVLCYAALFSGNFIGPSLLNHFPLSLGLRHRRRRS